MQKLLLTLITLFSLHLMSKAQAQEDLTLHRDFFRQQALEYQRWLDETGLGTVLKVHLIEPRPQELPLYLGFRNQRIDSIVVAWRTLKSKFDAQQPNSLEAELFYRLTYLMEVPDSVANVQIYNTYDPAGTTLFFRGIFHNGAGIKVDSSGSKADASFTLTLQDFRGLQKAKVEEQRARLSKPVIFQRIYKYAQQRYGRKNQPMRKPRLELRDSLETLRFEIKDLDREVLTDAEQPYWCQLIKKMGFADCNWVRREMLAFKVTHKTLPTGGFRLGITIDGKVGSGYYDKIRDNAYKPMTTDFNDYLERYAERFRLELRNYLLTGRP